ncbi:AAA family ATPase [Nocardia sp. NBC_01499]|uniref:AAA family ATPase n=1 Tax=Nocardia sp. NBC_01499 TaxID=2903597 RepID=UPI00386E412E
MIGTDTSQLPGAAGTGTGVLLRPDLYTNMDFDGADTAPEPTMCRRIDGQALLYPNAVNAIFGPPGEGKTWLMLAVVSETLNDGGRVLFIDVDDNGRGAIRWRLEAFGTLRETIADKGRFLYCTPSATDDLEAIVDDMKRWRPSLVVIDSIGTVVTMSGGSANDADDFNRVNFRVMVPMSQTGAVVAYIDHVSKNPDSARHGAQGSSAKLQRISGVSIRVTGKEPFIPGQGGQSVLTGNKDRHGTVSRNCVPMDDGSADKFIVGTFVMNETEDGIAWEISPEGRVAPQKAGQTRRDRLAELKTLTPAPRTGNEACERLGGNRKAALKAWDEFKQWQAEGGSDTTPPLGLPGTGTTPEAEEQAA